MSNLDLIVVVAGGIAIFLMLLMILVMVYECFKYVRDKSKDTDLTKENGLDGPDEVIDTSENNDSEYETRIMNYIRYVGIGIYYSNYSQTSVEVTGSSYGDGCVLIAKNATGGTDGDNIHRRTIEEWSENCSVSNLEPGICYAFRIGYKGSNYLIWGSNREEAYLNLFSFAVSMDMTYP